MADLATVDRIKIRMTVLGMNQHELADRLGAAPGTLAQYLSGRRAIPLNGKGKVTITTLSPILSVPARALQPDGPREALVAGR